MEYAESMGYWKVLRAYKFLLGRSDPSAIVIPVERLVIQHFLSSKCTRALESFVSDEIEISRTVALGMKREFLSHK